MHAFRELLNFVVGKQYNNSVAKNTEPTETYILVPGIL